VISKAVDWSARLWADQAEWATDTLDGACQSSRAAWRRRALAGTVPILTLPSTSSAVKDFADLSLGHLAVLLRGPVARLRTAHHGIVSTLMPCLRDLARRRISVLCGISTRIPGHSDRLLSSERLMKELISRSSGSSKAAGRLEPRSSATARERKRLPGARCSRGMTRNVDPRAQRPTEALK
jgi:hypothetical protein